MLISCSGSLSSSSLTYSKLTSSQIWKQRKRQDTEWDGEAVFMCVCTVCNSPWACPRSEGNLPEPAARTSPGLHLGGLDKDRGERERKSIRLSQSAAKFFNVCSFYRMSEPHTGLRQMYLQHFRNTSFYFAVHSVFPFRGLKHLCVDLGKVQWVAF